MACLCVRRALYALWRAARFARTLPLYGRGWPVTFFVLPKKVTKEKRANDDARYAGALRCSRRAASKTG
jgi:hypothetical protein